MKRSTESAPDAVPPDAFWTSFLLYTLAPLTIGGGLVGGFFFGPEWLQSAIAPANREYGLLENLQVLVLLVTAGLLFGVVRHASGPSRRWISVCMLSAVLFFFLEEIDYGLVYIDLWTGAAPTEAVSGRNIHNLGMVEQTIKIVGYLVFLLVFVIVPRRLDRERLGGLGPFLPSRRFLGTIVSAVAVGQAAFFLDERVGGVHGLSKNGHTNVSEFHELMVYLILALYAFELRCRMRPQEGGDATRGCRPGSAAEHRLHESSGIGESSHRSGGEPTANGSDRQTAK